MVYVFVLTIFLITVIIIFRFIWRKRSHFRNILMNIFILLFALGYTFLALEYVFSSFVVISDGFGFTLAMKKWHQIYWKPINSMGYRDKEHRWEKDSSSNILFVVGDSFAAGHGIENVHDRFSNILARKLGTQWEVVVLAKCGWQTDSEYDAMKQYPKRPSRIIVSYCLNDIPPMPQPHYHR